MPVEQPNQDQRRTEYLAYLASPAWQLLRTQALERDGHACRICNSSKRLDVHHRTYDRFGHEDLNDLTVLCRKCHEKHHNIAKAARPTKKGRRKPSRKVEKRSKVLAAVMQMEPGRTYTTQEMMRMAAPHEPGQPTSLDKFSQRAERDRAGREDTREQIRTVACPKCGASEGQPCLSGLGEPRKSNHQGRVSAHALKGLAA